MVRSAFDCDIPNVVRSVYLGILKAFEKGLIFRLRQIGVSRYMLDIQTDYLLNCLQRTTINGRASNWKNIQAGVPQAFVLVPLSFCFL